MFHTLLNRPLKTLALLAAFGALGASSASAGSIAIQSDPANSTSGLGAFTGSLDYTGTVLTVTLTNISDPGNGGYITGLLLNIDDADDDATATFVDTDDLSTTGLNESDFSNTGAGNGGQPFGAFEFGAALGGNFNGGGNPNKGIGVGQTGIFKFNVSDPDSEVFDVHDFLSEFSPGQGNNAKTAAMLVRFKGFCDDGSDKVPGAKVCPAVPLPPAAWASLSTLGLIGAVGMRRKIAGVALGLIS
ncbi:MAG: hypothetical protein ACREIT_03435 [Tepidisphaeraceae bacterium]